MIKRVLGIVLLLAGVAAAYFFAVPTLASVTEAQKDVETLKSLIEKTEQLNDVGNSVIERYQTVSTADLDRMDMLVPDQIDNVKFILELQQLAEKYGLLVQQVDVTGTSSREVAGQPINVVSLNAQLLGEYVNFVDFLEQLEMSQRIIDPGSLTFQALETEVGFFYDLSLDTYWRE